jgi:hypothetical protein
VLVVDSFLQVDGILYVIDPGYVKMKVRSGLGSAHCKLSYLVPACLHTAGPLWMLTVAKAESAQSSACVERHVAWLTAP